MMISTYVMKMGKKSNFIWRRLTAHQKKPSALQGHIHFLPLKCFFFVTILKTSSRTWNFPSGSFFPTEIRLFVRTNAQYVEIFFMISASWKVALFKLAIVVKSRNLAWGWLNDDLLMTFSTDQSSQELSEIRLQRLIISKLQFGAVNWIHFWCGMK